MSRSRLGPSVLGLLAAGALSTAALRADWSTASVAEPGMPRVDLAVTGAQAAPAATGLAIVVIASALGVLAAGPRLRRVIGALVLVVAVVGGVLASPFAADPVPGRTRALQTAAVSGADPSWSTSALWPTVAMAGFALAALVGALIAARGHRWATMGRRYDAPAAREADPSDLWKAMDDGVDPTD